jgi:pimeloyl-ACP methyl ester carboxylesterase
MGALIAIEIAARWPSLPSAVVAVDPAPAINPLPRTTGFFHGVGPYLEGPDAHSVLRAWFENFFSAHFDAETKRELVDAACSVPVRVAAAMWRAMDAWDGVAATGLCRAPVLFLLANASGSNDPQRLLAVRPNAQIGLTVGSGHFNQIEVPGQVISMIERFLEISVRLCTD